MKHLLNDLSEEVKNSIREQHEGGKKIVIENFKKLIETKSGDVKLYVTESTLDKKSFEAKMETAPEDNIDNVINSLVGKDKDEVKDYFLELKNTKPKWLKKLLRRVKKEVKKQANEFKKEIPKVLTAIGVYTLAYMIFKDKVDNFVEDNTNLK
jgi:hypothetical protein